MHQLQAKPRRCSYRVALSYRLIKYTLSRLLMLEPICLTSPSPTLSAHSCTQACGARELQLKEQGWHCSCTPLLIAMRFCLVHWQNACSAGRRERCSPLPESPAPLLGIWQWIDLVNEMTGQTFARSALIIEPFLKARLGIGQDCIFWAFGLTHTAIDAFVWDRWRACSRPRRNSPPDKPRRSRCACS